VCADFGTEKNGRLAVVSTSQAFEQVHINWKNTIARNTLCSNLQNTIQQQVHFRGFAIFLIQKYIY
jgi:hypothetical protein